MTAISPSSIVASSSIFDRPAAAPARAGTLRPYVSIVAPVGGQPPRRVQWFVGGVMEQCWRHCVPAELILVEWGREQGRPLSDATQWIEGSPCALRILTIPDTRDTPPTHSAIATNVGIRAAKAAYVLATNAGVVLSDRLMRRLAQRTLRPDGLYRADRVGIAEDPPALAGVEDLLAWCERRSGHPDAREWLRRLIASRAADDRGRTNTGVFALMHRDRWRELRGLPEPPTCLSRAASLFCAAARAAGVRERRLRCPVYHFGQPDEPQANGPDAGAATNGENWGLPDTEMNEWTP